MTEAELGVMWPCAKGCTWPLDGQETDSPAEPPERTQPADTLVLTSTRPFPGSLQQQQETNPNSLRWGVGDLFSVLEDSLDCCVDSRRWCHTGRGWETGQEPLR